MTLSKQEFLTSSGLEVQTLEFWLEQQWLIPEETSGGIRFSDGDIARARLIQDLKGDFGVNDEGVDVILHLVDQLHGLRRVLRQLHAEMGGGSTGATS
jgi:chaperone modulatory protein CbpM